MTMRVHLIGVCGTAMATVAALLKQKGFDVRGSDQDVYPPMSDFLAGEGIPVESGYHADHITGDLDLVVVGNAISRGNAELEEVLDRKIRYCSLPEAIREQFLWGARSIVLAGTHGKTTTTSLVSAVLGEAGLDPTCVIGGRLNSIGTNARLGKGEFLVAEADESDASFLYLQPVVSVVTNIDADHMETYGQDFEKLKSTFVEFLGHLPFYGLAVLCKDDAHVASIMSRVMRPMLTYGMTSDADLVARDVRWDAGRMRFSAVAARKEFKPLDVMLNLPGEHNVLNALAAIAVAREVGASDAAIAKGLAEFTGVGRRFQRYGDVPIAGGGRFTVVDDYGHHPAEMAATLAAARGAFPGRRILLAFQPHRFTRTRDLFEDFVRVLSTVDELVLADVYPAGEAPIVGADGRSLARSVRLAGKVEPLFVEKTSEMREAVLSRVRDGDVVLTMGAGSIANLAPELAIPTVGARREA
jgi:UDP-N-acetylmuramate--alanine ligase